MDVHHNARLTPPGREAWSELLTKAEAAQRFNASPNSARNSFAARPGFVFPLCPTRITIQVLFDKVGGLDYRRAG
jgi:hypothetical protein